MKGNNYEIKQNILSEGLNLDAIEFHKKDNSYVFALNMQNTTEENFLFSLSNENSNFLVANLPERNGQKSKIIGWETISDYEIILFLVAGEYSGIYLFNTISKNLLPIIELNESLNLKEEYPVDCTHRILNGERILYFTDNYNPPRRLNIDKIEQYFDNNNNLILDKLFLIKELYIPILDLKVEESGGKLLTGSYNMAIRYYDGQYNYTHWVEVSNVVNVYYSKITDKYDEIVGDIYTVTGNEKKVIEKKSENYVNKSLHLLINHNGNEKIYQFFEIAIIKYVEGTGYCTEVVVSPLIETKYNSFIYTGNEEGYKKIDYNELFFEKVDIGRVKHIEQLDNRLILANGAAKYIDYFDFQKYASKIVVKVVPEQVAYNDIKSKNSKNPNSFIMGVQTGEVYALGIVYIFKDGTLSPVFHIPSISTFSSTINVNGENILTKYLTKPYYVESYKYPEIKRDNNSFWDTDFLGTILEGTNIKHHRIPTLAELGLELVDSGDVGGGYMIIEKEKININLEVTINLNDNNPRCAIEPEFISQENIKSKIYFKIIFIDNTELNFVKEFENENYCITNGTIFQFSHEITDSNYLKEIKSIEIKNCIFLYVTQDLLYYKGKEIPIQLNELSLTYNVVYNKPELIIKSNYTPAKINIINLEFLNIQKPHPDVIGYYIVVGEKTDENRRIVDKGIMGFIKYKKLTYTQSGYYHDEYKADDNLENYAVVFSPTSTDSKYNINDGYLYNKIGYLSKYVFIKSPKILFNNENLIYNNIEIEQVIKTLNLGNSNIGKTDLYRDAVLGHGNTGSLFYVIPIGDKDANYYSVLCNYTTNYDIPQNLVHTKFEVQERYFLPPLNETQVRLEIDNSEYNYLLANIQFDAPCQVIKLDKAHSLNTSNLYYVMLINDDKNLHGNLDTIKYFRLHNKPVFFDSNISKVKIDNGDIIISRLPITQYTHYKVAKKRYVGLDIVNMLTVIALGTVTAILTYSVSIWLTAAAILLTTGGVLATSIKNLLKKLFDGKFIDYVYKKFFIHLNLPNNTPHVLYNGKHAPYFEGSLTDDLYIGYAESFSSIFFQSPINIGLRGGMEDKLHLFMIGNNIDFLKQYIHQKTTYFDSKLNRYLYKLLFTDAEFFKYNPDFSRIIKEKVYFPIPFSYDFNSKIIEQWPNRIYWSLRSFEEEKTDSYTIFLSNNYRDIPSEYGEVTAIKTLKDKLFVFTERTLYYIPHNVRLNIDDNYVSYIGGGEFLSLEPQKFIDDEIGLSGTKYKNSIIKYRDALIYVNSNTNTINIVSTNNYDDIGKINIRKWLQNNMNFEIADFYKKKYNEEYPLLDKPQYKFGVGFIIAIDNKNQRLIITKKDIWFNNNINLDNLVFNKLTNTWFYNNTPLTVNDFINLSWTLSYSFISQKWISFHSYLPYCYIFNNKNFWSIPENIYAIFEHNKQNEYGNFYQKQYNSIIDFVIAGGINKSFLEYIGIRTLAKRYLNDSDYVILRDVFFNNAIIYNSRQCTGLQDIIIRNIDDEQINWLFTQVRDRNNQIKAINRNGIYFINDIRNFVINYDLPMFIEDKKHSLIQQNYFIDKVLNPQVIDYNKNWHELELLKDYYFNIRLIYNNSQNNINFVTDVGVIFINNQKI